MDKLIAAFAEQLKEAIKIGSEINLSKASEEIKNIVVIGMGGSGIGADFAMEFSAEDRSVPMQICKSYDIPAYVNKNTLVICSSFSGNTEETLSGFHKALEKNAKIICIAAGGKLIELAKLNHLDYILLPGAGLPPRACLGYSMVQQLFVLKFYGFLKPERIDELKNGIELIEKEEEFIKVKADRVARFLVGKLPVIYSTDRMGAVAVRLRQQFNENSKVLALHHLIPEMNHNELVGWRKQPNSFAVLIFRTKDDHPQNQARIDINKEIISHYTDTIIEIFAKGESLIEQAIYCVHLSDWLSWELAQLREVDATEVKVIDYLKGQLANTEK